MYLFNRIEKEKFSDIFLKKNERIVVMFLKIELQD